MHSSTNDATTHARLYELAKARAHQLRHEAITAFWRSVATAVQRAAAACTRAIAAPMQVLPRLHNTHPKV